MDDSIDNDALIGGQPTYKPIPPAEKVEQEEYVEQLFDENRTMPFTKFFTFLEGSDWVLLIFGTTSAIIAGALLPAISLVMGHVSSLFVDAQYGII